ncbi:hypothetical protein BDF19DRAFT_301766 [Syncephalis fuscata]|nr:hypothetical protein BDF19DRAFT_301766 [Syncephalis fuscata]
MRWEYHALHGFVMLLIVLGLMSFALLLIRQKLHDDAQDMRTHGQELMLSVVSWTAILSIYIALALTAEQTKGGRDPRVFPATNLFVIGCFLDHVVSVAWPTYRAYFNLGNAGWRNINASTIAGVKSIQITGSRAQFQKLLSDPKRFREFKLFSIRNMSVENAFFYDACRSLLKSSELHDIALTEGNADPGYKDRLVRRLMWLYTTFLRASADMEVNLLGTTRRRLERAARDGVLDIPIMKKAMNEVEELMFYDTYQRYLRQHGDEVDSDVGNETTTSVTEMTNVKHKHSS